MGDRGCVFPVSYTHLDVYKRQSSARTPRLRQKIVKFSLTASGRSPRVKLRFIDAKTPSLTPPSRVEKPVSYTHLDVYKRQEGYEEEFHIVKSKSFPVKPLDVEEAILQMNLIGHQFYICLLYTSRCV